MNADGSPQAALPEGASSLPTPRIVCIETINGCNARCTFCALFQGDAIMDRDRRPMTIMSASLFEKVLGELRSWDIRPNTLFLNMNGEPLLDPLFLDRLEALTRHGLAPLIELQTNGQFLDESKAAALVKAGVGRIVIGFDGATEDVYRQHRVRCDYKRVLGNIRRLAELRTAAGAKTSIAIQYVRTHQNDHEVMAAYDMFGEFLDPEKDTFQDNPSKDFGDTASDTDLYYLPKITAGRPEGCQVFEQQLIISADGRIAACCWDYNLSVSNGGFGDANERPLWDIWSSVARQALRQRILQPHPDDLPEKCSDCIFMYGTDDLPAEGAKIDDPALLSISPYTYTYRFRPKHA